MCFDDVVNEFREKAMEADGFIFGSPVHFSSATGNITAFYGQIVFIPTSAETEGNHSNTSLQQQLPQLEEQAQQQPLIS